MDTIRDALTVLAGLADRDRDTVAKALRGNGQRSPRAAAYNALADIAENVKGQMPSLVALSRSSDPSTSRQAVEKLNINVTRRRVLDFARLKGDSGFIDDDLRTYAANGETLRKRRSDLSTAGYLEPVPGCTRVNRAGNNEQLWRITAKGREAL